MEVNETQLFACQNGVPFGHPVKTRGSIKGSQCKLEGSWHAVTTAEVHWVVTTAAYLYNVVMRSRPQRSIGRSQPPQTCIMLACGHDRSGPFANDFTPVAVSGSSVSTFRTSRRVLVTPWLFVTRLLLRSSGSWLARVMPTRVHHRPQGPQLRRPSRVHHRPPQSLQHVCRLLSNLSTCALGQMRELRMATYRPRVRVFSLGVQNARGR